MTTNDTPLVTFIITYYNLPTDMLRECIDSILNLSLTPQEREIIVVDDGSDISPMNELMQYGDQIVYVRQKNGGLSSARNLGLEMAQGYYIQFVDSDDKLIQTPYNHCIDIIRGNNNVDMVMFDFEYQPYKNTIYKKDEGPISGTHYLRYTNLHGTACGYVFRKAILGELRFTLGIYHEDEEFTPQLVLRAEYLYHTSAKAYFYNNNRTGSITNASNATHIEKRHNDILGVICRLNTLVDRLPHNDQLAIQRRVAQLTMNYIYNIIMDNTTLYELNSQLAILRSKGLFPLPDRNYTQKYKWFRRMTNSRIGRTILLRTLPLMKHER